MALTLVAACHPAAVRPPPPSASTAPELEFLLDASARDFHQHAPPKAVGFRNVRFGVHTAREGERRPLLCGQVLAAGPDGSRVWTPFVTIKTGDFEQWLGGQALAAGSDGSRVWTPFVTIKTGDFEQWLGGQAVSWCQSPDVTWGGALDLSSTLEARLDALR